MFEAPSSNNFRNLAVPISDPVSSPVFSSGIASKGGLSLIVFSRFFSYFPDTPFSHPSWAYLLFHALIPHRIEYTLPYPINPVSYTHLTLPTIYSVSISV